MTFPLGSLRADGAAAARPASPLLPPRWRRQLQLAAGAVAWILFLLALVTHDAGVVAEQESAERGDETDRQQVGEVGSPHWRRGAAWVG
jgi:hypothetical protein